MRIAIYLRVSTERQFSEGESIDAQRKVIEEWASRHSATVVSVYEEAASASKDRRPQFERMIADALVQPAPFDAVVVYSISRFARNTKKLISAWEDLLGNQVKVFSATENLPEDRGSQMFVRNILGSVAELYSIENSDRVYLCQRENARNGYYNGAPTPFGYKSFATDIPSRSGVKKRLVIHPQEADVVRKIFSLAIDGLAGRTLGVKRIAEHLNESGQSRRGRPWTKQSVHYVLNNETYAGRYQLFKMEARTRKLRDPSEWITIPVEPIIDEESFAKAQRLLGERNFEKREWRAKESPTLLTGLLKCHCGRNLRLMTGKGGRYAYYQCGAKSDRGARACKGVILPKEETDEAVLIAVCQEVLVPERIEKLVAQMNARLRERAEPDARRLLVAQRSAAMVEQRLTSLYQQLGDGHLSMDTVLARVLQDLRKELDTHKAEIASISLNKQVPLRRFGLAQIEAFTNYVRGELMTPASPLARSYLQAIVQEIRVDPSQLVATGSAAQMAAAVAYTRPGAPITVPRLVSEWRAPPPSKRRPARSRQPR